MRILFRVGGWIAILSIALLGQLSCSGYSNDINFFRNKTVTIIVPHGEGGGMDAYARLIAPYLQKYLPGSKVVVSNVPEDNSLRGDNQIYAAEADGLTLGFTTIGGKLLAEWAGLPGIQYRAAEFSLIGRIVADANILAVSPSSGLKNFDDILQAGEVSMGFSGLTSDDYYVSLVTARLLGYKVEAHTYASSGEAGLACAKGEVQAILYPDSTIQPQIQAKTVLPIVSFSVERAFDLPNIPTILEVAPAEKQETLKALVGIYQLGRTLIGPPKMSAGRLAVLREALDKAMADPDFLQSAESMKRPVDYMNGAETASVLEGILASQAQLQPLVADIQQGSQ